jgi:DNA-binding response OmpR family regulator
MLVDDEHEFVKALAERLEMRDLPPDKAYSGEEALEKVARGEPDVMILDLKMPGIDGMEVLRQIRKAYPGVQVIMLTAHGTDKDEDEAMRLGAYAYLQKPVALDVLVKTMRQAYQKKMEDVMVAATFAEAGDFKTAVEIMEEDKKKK